MSEKSRKELLAKTFSDILAFVDHYKMEIFCMVIIWAALFISLSYTNSRTVTTQSRAESVCNYRDNPQHPCNGHAPNWSTCDGSGRWGCDGSCNYKDLPDSWCEGTTQKTCSSGDITQVTNSPVCGGGGPNDPCAGKSGSICESVGDNNGSVTVLNCTRSEQTYTCQKNHTTFTDVTSCNNASRTDNWTSYDGMSVAVGARGTCSVDSGGDCNIGQADIRQNNSTICWDVVKTCTNCSPLTPTPRLTPTSTPTPTPIPCDAPCDGFSDRRCAIGLTCQPYGVAFLCKNPSCPIERQTNCRCLNLTPTPTTVLARCVRLEPTKPLDTLKIGDEINFGVGYTGLPEDIAFRVFKDGQILETRFQSTLPDFMRFRFTSPGRYSFAAYVKSGGVWR